jgi:hypothetical protein
LNQASNVAKSLESNEEEDIQYVFGKTLNELTEEFNEGYLKSNVNRDIIPKVNKVKFINKGEFKGKYEILDVEIKEIIKNKPEEVPFNKMYASYTFMNDIGMPSTIYLKESTDVGDIYEQIDLDGSNGQTGIGFVFGPRPTNKQVREVINSANNTEQAAPAPEEASPFQDKINKDLDSGGTITSDGSSISSDFTTDEGQILLTDDLLNQMESYDYAKEEITSKDNNQAAKEFMNEFFDNNENARAKLIDSGIRSVEDLIAKFNAANKLNTSLSFNSYIEDVIKKCGL